MSSVTPALHVGDEARGGDTVQRRHRRGLVGERSSAALLGEQVDRERRVAARGEPAGHRADVVGEAAVLVDHEDAAAWLRRTRPCPHQLAPAGAPERDRCGRVGDHRLGRALRRCGCATGPSLPGGKRGEERSGGRHADADERQPAECLTSRDQPVRVIERDLFDQVLLELCHRLLHDRSCRGPDRFSRTEAAAVHIRREVAGPYRASSL